MVSVRALLYNDLSSNPAVYYSYYFVKFFKTMKMDKTDGDGTFKKNFEHNIIDIWD